MPRLSRACVPASRWSFETGPSGPANTRLGLARQSALQPSPASHLSISMSRPSRHQPIQTGGAPKVAGFEFVAATDHHITSSSDARQENSHALFYIGGAIAGLLVILAAWAYLDTLDSKLGRPSHTNASGTNRTQAAPVQSKPVAPLITNTESSRLRLGPALPMHTLERPPSTIISPGPRHAPTPEPPTR